MKASRLVSISFITSALLPVLSLECARASVSYTTPSASYSQNFDSLPITPLNTSLGTSPIGWTDDNASPGAGNFSIVGWYLWAPISASEGGFNGHQRVRIGAGTANTGSFMSWGANSSTDRALGSLDSNTMASDAAGDSMSIGLRISNDTGITLTDFTLTYDGEQWRNGGSGTANALRFSYSLTASTANWTNATGGPDFTAVSALDFIAPVVGTTAAAVDGNVAGKTAGITATISGLSWAPGTDLWLRWQDLSDAGADDGLGIDNLSFSAVSVPEPASASVIGLGACLLLVRRKNLMRS